jgi:hypothetical protein
MKILKDETTPSPVFYCLILGLTAGKLNAESPFHY